MIFLVKSVYFFKILRRIFNFIKKGQKLWSWSIFSNHQIDWNNVKVLEKELRERVPKEINEATFSQEKKERRKEKKIGWVLLQFETTSISLLWCRIWLSKQPVPVRGQFRDHNTSWRHIWYLGSDSKQPNNNLSSVQVWNVNNYLIC